MRIAVKEILKSSASKNGFTSKSITGLSQPIKFPNHNILKSKLH